MSSASVGSCSAPLKSNQDNQAQLMPNGSLPEFDAMHEPSALAL
jgi:hypothetical protein